MLFYFYQSDNEWIGWKNLNAGFKGSIGIEFEGTEISEEEGINTTKALIEKVLK